MEIKTKVDARGLLLKLNNGQRKLAYAVANGINDTAKRIQQDTREEVKREFTLRGQKGAFVLRQAAIVKPFANAKQGRPFAIIQLGKRDRLLLPQFETGGEKKPIKGKNVAVPLTGTPARPTFGASVPKEYQFSQLRLKKQKKGNRWVGRMDTYLVPGVGVFKRLGPGKRNSRLIYAFDADVPVPKRLAWTALWRSRGERYLDNAIDDRIRKEVVRNAGRI